MIRVLTFTNLYPSSVRPQHGLFIEHRVRRVASRDDVDVRVVAPVPWFPFRSKAFGDWATHAATPRKESRHGVDIAHPRYLVIPKVGMRFTPGAMARAALPLLRKIQQDGFDFDIIDAHYFYPDGVAAVRLGEALGKPVVITARGSDVNLIPEVSAFAREAVLDAARRCQSIVVVSDALRSALTDLGAPADKIEVIRNGVDRELFRLPANARTPESPHRVLSVGSLLPNKGHHLVVEAMRELDDAKLTIAGRGPMRDELEALAKQHDVTDRVTFAGSVDQERLRALYGEADALVLASEMEGLPNVLLESLACGTPVVATDVGGIPEVVTSRDAGRLVEERSAAAIAGALRDLLGDLPSREAARASIDAFDWSQCVDQVVETFRRATGKS